MCFACLKHGYGCKENLQYQESSGLHPTLLNISNEASTQNSILFQVPFCKLLKPLILQGPVSRILLFQSFKAQKGTTMVKIYAFVDPGSSATFAGVSDELNIKYRVIESGRIYVGRSGSWSCHNCRNLTDVSSWNRFVSQSLVIFITLLPRVKMPMRWQITLCCTFKLMKLKLPKTRVLNSPPYGIDVRWTHLLGW